MDFTEALFFINLAWIATHELDAIEHHEWRIFPLTAPLPERMGYYVFTAAHVPLFALLIAAAGERDFQIGFDLFLIFHAGLHWLYRNHPHYEFQNVFSNILIFGGIPLGVLHLALLF